GLVIDLGHAQLSRAALDGLGLGEEGEAALHAALKKKDVAQVAELAARAQVSPKRRKLVAQLPSLYGGPEGIVRTRPLCEGTEAPRARAALELLIERLSALGAFRLTVDLGEVRGFRYYTGTRF